MADYAAAGAADIGLGQDRETQVSARSGERIGGLIDADSCWTAKSELGEHRSLSDLRPADAVGRRSVDDAMAAQLKRRHDVAGRSHDAGRSSCRRHCIHSVHPQVEAVTEASDRKIELADIERGHVDATFMGAFDQIDRPGRVFME